MNYEETTDFLGKVNKMIYGVNPYSKKCAYPHCDGEGIVKTEDEDKNLCDDHEDYLSLKD